MILPVPFREVFKIFPDGIAFWDPFRPDKGFQFPVGDIDARFCQFDDQGIQVQVMPFHGILESNLEVM
tara:strand:+ start:190 stop:393 length:204 start_codon:yes stop_codon:yes gene_type:complete